jgi:uncharacterized membrane protein (UPF0127 family)
MRQRTANPILIIMVVIACCLTSACGWTQKGKVSFHPALTPVEISVTTDGKVALSLGAEWVTPIGTFGIGADVEQPDDNSTLLAIAHRNAAGRPVQERYSISSDERLGVCFNGSAYGEFGDHRIFLNAFDGASTIRIVAAGSRCPSPPQQRVRAPSGSGSRYPRIRVAVGSTVLTVLIADTPDKISHGLSGVRADQLGPVAGMLYVLSAPQTFDPATGDGAFVFNGYLFLPEVHFFDANAQYWAGGPTQPCSVDRSDCRQYYATLFGTPVPYQYVLELIRGRLGTVAPGTPLRVLPA